MRFSAAVIPLSLLAVAACTDDLDGPGDHPIAKSTQLVQYANTQLKRKVLFGTDYPLITPERWLADFAKVDIRDDVRPLILKHNAIELLKLDA